MWTLPLLCWFYRYAKFAYRSSGLRENCPVNRALLSSVIARAYSISSVVCRKAHSQGSLIVILSNKQKCMVVDYLIHLAFLLSLLQSDLTWHLCTLGNIGKNALTLMRRRAMSIRLFQLNLVPKFFICIGLLLIHRIIIILCIFDRVCLLSETSKISLIFPVCKGMPQLKTVKWLRQTQYQTFFPGASV